MNNTFGFVVILVGSVTCTAVGVWGGVGVMQRLAIKHHAAHYDATTGQFTWNDSVEPPTKKETP